jgi:aryl-alcohol dehydrogenase-like predicted oxidoreductase
MEMPGQGQGLSPEWINRAIEASLARLGVERIDLYQAHRDDETVPLEETLGAFARLMAEGKVGAIGASNYTAPRLKAALEASARGGLPRFESLQPHHNLMERDIERDLLPLCREEEVGVIPYYALAAGFLTGKYRSEADLGKSPRGARSGKQYLNERGMRVLAALDDAAARLGATPAQVALAWQAAKPGITASIASATSEEQLAGLVKAASLRLDREAMEALDAASA